MAHSGGKIAGVAPSAKVGTLTDEEVLFLGNSGELITENFRPESIKQACYELRASDTYYEPPDHASRTAEDGEIIIRPRHLVVIITKESVDLPENVLGRILTKGQLFSIGLLPVNTYADPGFSGRLGIVLHNVSENYIRIKPGDCIAKIEFSRLENAVKHPYDGQHGYQTKIWPIPVDKILKAEEVATYKKKHKIESITDEMRWLYGGRLDEVLARIFKFERRLILFTILYFTLTLLVLFLPLKESVSANLATLGIGVAGSLIASALIWKATRIGKD